MKRFGVNKLYYDRRVLSEDVPRLDDSVYKRIKLAIENKLTSEPQIYGEPLRGSLKLRWKLRVGDWRVIYTISGKEVRIHAIGHRSNIYKITKDR